MAIATTILKQPPKGADSVGGNEDNLRPKEQQFLNKLSVAPGSLLKGTLGIVRVEIVNLRVGCLLRASRANSREVYSIQPNWEFQILTRG